MDDPLTIKFYSDELIRYGRIDYGAKYRAELLKLWRIIAQDRTCREREAYRIAVATLAKDEK